MTGSAEQSPQPVAGQPLWEIVLGPSAVVPQSYYEGFNRTLCEILGKPPERALELGCAGGRLGEHEDPLVPDVRELEPGAGSDADRRNVHPHLAAEVGAWASR